MTILTKSILLGNVNSMNKKQLSSQIIISFGNLVAKNMGKSL